MNEKRGPAAEKKRKAQMDQRYQNIMRRFGSIEAYEQARQEGKFYKPPPIATIAATKAAIPASWSLRFFIRLFHLY